MTAGLLIAAAVLLAAVALHPFVTYPLTLLVLRRLRPRPVRLEGGEELAAHASVALCVCAYNEARIIGRTVEQMIALRERVPQLEILVYVDGATDGTADILRGFGDAIRFVASPTRHGKTHGMNTLVGMTSAEFVVFTDANVTFAPDAIPNLLRRFADPEVGCVCGHLVYTRAASTATAATGSLYWQLEEYIKGLESEVGSVTGADGSIFAIRRALHRPPPPDIIDDMYVSLAILCGGHRVVRAGDALAFEPVVSRSSDEFQRKIRISCQSFNVNRALWHGLMRLPPVERSMYIGHRLLRWGTPYLLVLATLLAVAGLAMAGAWALLALLLAGAAGWALWAWLRPASAAGKVLSILGAFAATGIGVWRSIQGERFQTWSPPVSARSRPDI
jgi:hypothetical protein